MRNSFTREGGSTIFRTPSAESSLSYWRESSIFLQINPVTEECSISGVFHFSFNFAIHREHFPIPNWFRKLSTLKFSMSDLKLVLLPCHLFKSVPDLHGFPCPGERLPCCPPVLSDHLGSSSSLTRWLVSSSELLSESASFLHSQLPQIWSLSSLTCGVAATSSPGRLTSSLPLTPHSIPKTSPLTALQLSKPQTHPQLLVSQKVAWKP